MNFSEASEEKGHELLMVENIQLHLQTNYSQQGGLPREYRDRGGRGSSLWTPQDSH